MLLSYVNARVHRQSLVRPLKGRVCVGVRRGGRTRWWIGDFGQVTETRFDDSLPSEFDVALAVDARTARWILGAAGDKGPMHMLAGDKSLWRAFVKTYLAHNDFISLRVGGGA